MTRPSGDAESVENLLARCFDELAAGREPNLAALCAGDTELRSRLEMLIERERRHIAARGNRPSPSSARLGALPAALGGFSIEALIGRGGMGHVYRARQESLGRAVALKVLRADALDDRSAVLRFQREASITARLDHPNIVPVYATGTDGGFHFLAMKLLQGSSLDQGPRPLDAHTVAELGAAVARALQAAHEVGVVHRDVKPANVFVENGTPFLLDFGLARIRGAATAITAASAAPGTLAYMAPELLRPRAVAYDPRVDIYGLGATLYELLSGRNPFASDSPLRTIRHVLFRDPPRLRLGGRDLDLETIVLRCLDKAPQKRFSTAAELADDLDRYLAGEPIRSRPTGPATRWIRRARRHPWTAASITGLLAMTLAAVLILWRTAVERVDRIERRSRAVAASIEGRDPDRLAIELGRLTEDEPRHPRCSEWEADLDALTATRDLIVFVQTPEVEYDPALADGLASRLRSSRSKLARTPLAQSCLTLLDLARGQAIDPLPEPVAAAFPAFAALVATCARGADAPAAEASAVPGGGVDAVLRRVGLRWLGSRSSVGDLDADLPAEPIERDAVQFAQVVARAFGQRGEAALEALDDLLTQASSAALARIYRCQLLADMGRIAAAHAEWDIARQRAARLPHVRVALGLAELRLLRASRERERFWKAWTAAEHLHRQPMYWHHGAIAAFDDGNGVWALAIATRGLAAIRPGPARWDLEAFALELRWNLIEGATDYDVAAELDPAEREAIERLAADALPLAQRLDVAGIRDSRALLVAARCARALGDREQGWALLERACTEARDAAALADFAYAVALRVLYFCYAAEFDAADLPAGGSIQAAARLAVERAREVLGRGGPHATSNRGYRARAELGLCLGAWIAGEPMAALRSSCELTSRFTHPQLDPEWAFASPLQDLVAGVKESGGLCRTALQGWPESTRGQRLDVLTRAALDAIRCGIEEGWFAPGLVPTVARAWEEPIAGMVVDESMRLELAQAHSGR